MDGLGRRRWLRERARERMISERMAFEQAAIKVEKAEEFARLRSAIEHAFAGETVERFLKHAERKGIRIRDLSQVLAERVLESVAESELNARQLYESLTTSDQAQTREFYLSKLETVEPGLRHRFKRLYQYY
jgi:hypothetical protein